MDAMGVHPRTERGAPNPNLNPNTFNANRNLRGTGKPSLSWQSCFSGLLLPRKDSTEAAESILDLNEPLDLNRSRGTSPARPAGSAPQALGFPHKLSEAPRQMGTCPPGMLIALSKSDITAGPHSCLAVSSDLCIPVSRPHCPSAHSAGPRHPNTLLWRNALWDRSSSDLAALSTLSLVWLPEPCSHLHTAGATSA